MNYSLTIASFISLILRLIFGPTIEDLIPQDEIVTVLNAGWLVISLVGVWWGRVRKGDVTWYGRKV